MSEIFGFLRNTTFFHQIFSPTSQLKVWSYRNYRNDPKFWDRYAWANSADPDQTRSSLIRVYTVCHSVCIVWTHYSMVEPHSSNFRVITTNFLGVRIFRKFTVMILSFRMDRSWQTVQTQRSSLIRVYTVCNSVCIFWTHDSIVEPHCSNFRISTAIFRVSELLGVLQCFL